MRRNILSSIYILTVFSVFMACAPRKSVGLPPEATIVQIDTTKKDDSIGKVDYLKMLKGKNVAFNTLTLKGKAKLNIDGDQNNVSILMKIKKDEMIWISVSSVIGEVARVSITPDSIRIINRLETTYTKKPFNFIYTLTNKNINFQVLQDILTGNLILDFINPSVNPQLLDGAWAINGNVDSLSYTFLYNMLLRLKETQLNDVKASQALKISYDDYKTVNGLLFPSTMNINSLAGPSKIDVALSFNTIEYNLPLDLPFSVKSRFKVIN